jgi:hypothetical protein
MALDAAVEQPIGVGLLGVQARQELRARIECGGKQWEECIGHGGFSAGVPWLPRAAIAEKGDILRVSWVCVAVACPRSGFPGTQSASAPAFGFGANARAESTIWGRFSAGSAAQG